MIGKTAKSLEPSGIVTLTTDFGEVGSYVGQMKGVILSLARQAAIVDITHSIGPQNVRQAAMILDEATRRFPAGTVHVAVIDPGVGTARRILAARIGSQYYVAPDNGLLSLLASRYEGNVFVELTERKYWLPEVSATFHGRDIMAPVAARLLGGLAIEWLGRPINQLHECVWPEPALQANRIVGQVIAVDTFGNAITNIDRDHLPDVSSAPQWKITSNSRAAVAFVATYGQAAVGDLVALCGSSGRLEFAVVNGSAAKEFGFEVGDEAVVEWP
ncbi:MAG: SAM-dependent chlorinase/fluorinase [Pirellulaceae bacterium]